MKALLCEMFTQLQNDHFVKNITQYLPDWYWLIWLSRFFSAKNISFCGCWCFCSFLNYLFFVDLSEFGRLEKQYLKHLEQLEAEAKVWFLPLLISDRQILSGNMWTLELPRPEWLFFFVITGTNFINGLRGTRKMFKRKKSFNSFK